MGQSSPFKCQTACIAICQSTDENSYFRGRLSQQDIARLVEFLLANRPRSTDNQVRVNDVVVLTVGTTKTLAIVRPEPTTDHGHSVTDAEELWVQILTSNIATKFRLSQITKIPTSVILKSIRVAKRSTPVAGLRGYRYLQIPTPDIVPGSVVQCDGCLGLVQSIILSIDDTQYQLGFLVSDEPDVQSKTVTDVEILRVYRSHELLLALWELIQDEKWMLEKKESGVNTKRSRKAIASAHYLATIIAQFFEADDCCNMNLDITTILQNILVVGGAPRSFWIDHEINDIDVICNTRELNKIHLDHLKNHHLDREYQRRDNPCVLWQLYLKRFSEEGRTYDDIKRKHDVDVSSREFISECPYILNCKYIVETIMVAKIPAHKARIEYITSMHCAYFRHSVIHAGYNLKGCSYDLFDSMCWESHKRFFMETYKDLKPNVKQIRKRAGSVQSATSPPNMSGLDESLVRSVSLEPSLFEIYSIPETKPTRDSDYLEIRLPIFKTSWVEMLCSLDFSFNMLSISLLDIIQHSDSSHNLVSEYRSAEIDFEWTPKIQNIFDDVKYDIQDQMIRHPYPEYVVAAHQPNRHFWRCIKFIARLSKKGWTMDQELIDEHKKWYDKWLGSDEFWMTKNFTLLGYSYYGYEEFPERMFKLLKKESDFEEILNAFEVMESDEWISKAFRKYDHLRAMFVERVRCRNDLNETEMLEMLEKRGYW